ncbi:IS4 family transposase [Thiotrichales bacterium HSG14]|nr:IS4 family transposase [Thiotrichales bacterium HSG14]
MEIADRLEPCLALYMIIAWRALFVTMFGRIYPALRCEFIFTKEEWQAVHLVLNQTPLPSIPPSLGEIIPMIGRLGGHLGRKCDGHPESQINLEGVQNLFCEELHSSWQNQFCTPVWKPSA